MVNLPPLDDKKDTHLKITLPEVDSLDPEYNKRKVMKHFEEIEFIENTNSNVEVESKYRRMLSVASSQTEDLETKYIEELKSSGLYEIDKLEQAIENSTLDIGKYNIVILSKIIKNLESMRRPKSLHEFNINDMSEFYSLVGEGSIEIEKYSTDELDEFIVYLISK